MKTRSVVGKLLIALALTFVIPQIVFVYIWEDLPARLSYLLLGCTALLGGIGCYLIWDIIQSIRSIFRDIKGITKDELKLESAPAEDELHFVGNSIETISKKIVENMQELQQSAVTIEKTKKELNQALLYIENVMNSMGDTLIVVDPNFQIHRVNRAAKELLKYTENDILDLRIGHLFETINRSLFSDGAIVKGKRMTFVTREKEKIPVDVNIRPLLDPKGSLLGYVLVARDMRITLALIARLEHMNAFLEETVRKRTEVIAKVYEELKIKDAQMLQQEKMASIGVLAAGLAHEMNNPVGYISSNLEVLREEVHDVASYLKELEDSHVSLVDENNQSIREREGDRIRQVRSVVKIDQFFQDSEAILRESKEGLDRIKRIILDLKKFSHPDENKMENVNLNHEIESTLNVLASELKYRVKVIKEFDELPLIKCFQHQLNQVLMNILINAAQAIEERGVITIRTFLKDDCINVLIRDTGAGMPPEHLKKIFDPFFTTKPVGEGTGLGLYISYGVIEKHQGEISVESEVGKGSAFTIRLPLHPSEARLETGMSSPS